MVDYGLNNGGRITLSSAGFPSDRGRIAVGSVQDSRRLGAGFPSTRGRIPVSPEQEIPVGSGQDFPSARGKISVGLGQEAVGRGKDAV